MVDVHGHFARDLLARCTFPPPGTEVACAVSGGADSLALLVLAVAVGCRVTAVHVDHGLRPGSAAEGEVVRKAAEWLGAGFRAERVVVEPGPNLEARARAARFAALPPGVLTGHTADDQAETVLLNLMRGAGLDGLAGIGAAPSSGPQPARRSGTQPARRSGTQPVGHPILALRRHETRALCRDLGLRWVEDPSNADPAHRRNRVRAELVPLLDDIAGRDVVPVLARQAGVLREEAALLDALAAELDPTDARALAAAPLPLARRAARRWLLQAASGDVGGLGGHPPDLAAVDRMLAVARREAKAAEVGGGWRVARTQGRLRLQRPERC